MAPAGEAAGGAVRAAPGTVCFTLGVGVQGGLLDEKWREEQFAQLHVQLIKVLFTPSESGNESEKKRSNDKQKSSKMTNKEFLLLLLLGVNVP